MSNKQKKKRSKVYQGADATVSRPVITKISAANRNRVGQWWFEHKRVARPVIIGVVIATVITILIIELVRIASNG